MVNTEERSNRNEVVLRGYIIMSLATRETAPITKKKREKKHTAPRTTTKIQWRQIIPFSFDHFQLLICMLIYFYKTWQSTLFPITTILLVDITPLSST